MENRLHGKTATALTIAGSDSGGGAGIQADLKTFMAHRVYGMSVITAVTAQNTMEVSAIEEISPDMIGQQLDSIFTDIIPDAIKIGMVCSADTIAVISRKLIKYKAKKVILDPVMISTSGHSLMKSGTMEYLIQNLFSAADIITPNIPEAECLAGGTIWNHSDMEMAAKKISEFYKGTILIKGGHLENCADDLLFIRDSESGSSSGRMVWLKKEKLNTKHTHGTGCTFSSAIAANLAMGYPVEDAVRNAKKYLYRAILHAPGLGHGNGPVNHMTDVI